MVRPHASRRTLLRALTATGSVAVLAAASMAGASCSSKGNPAPAPAASVQPTPMAAPVRTNAFGVMVPGGHGNSSDIVKDLGATWVRLDVNLGLPQPDPRWYLDKGHQCHPHDLQQGRQQRRSDLRHPGRVAPGRVPLPVGRNVRRRAARRPHASRPLRHRRPPGVGPVRERGVRCERGRLHILTRHGRPVPDAREDML